jgi:hypothetical protein
MIEKFYAVLPIKHHSARLAINLSAVCGPCRLFVRQGTSRSSAFTAMGADGPDSKRVVAQRGVRRNPMRRVSRKSVARHLARP